MDLEKNQAKERIGKLKREINHHRYLYHVLDRQEISDAALDSLKHELEELEEKYPEFITPDSPTQRVGGKPLAKFEKVKHSQPMLSLVDAFSEEELKNWEARILRLLSKGTKLDYFTELKIDGFGISLVYENGIFTTGATRGDGRIGENVTQNLKTIESIPLRLETQLRPSGFAGRVEVRGEIFMSKKEFEKVNKKQEKKGLPIYANPRNLGAGSVRQLDPKITASRKLDSFMYEMISPEPDTHQEKHELLKKLGFKTSNYVKHCQNLTEVIDYCKSWINKRNDLPFLVDGVVIIVNNTDLFKKLGVVGKTPRGSIAYKFPAEQATTILLDIKVSIGRTGALTPYAVLKPVQVAGSVISRATLHNEDEIKRKDIRIGDTVIIQKAGDVIPEVVQVLPKLRTGKEKQFQMPKQCPFCNSPVIKPAGEAVARCSNPKCFAVEREKLIHFASKGSFGFVGVSEQMVNKFLEEGLVKDAADFFTLKKEDLMSLPGFKEKLSSKIIDSIQSQKKISLPNFIFALGIRHVGIQTAQDLTDYFGDLGALAKANLENLESVPNIGEVVAKSIYNWFRDQKNQLLLQKFQKLGIGYEKIHKTAELSGETFIITGSLKSMTREEAEELIRQKGGKASSSLSRTTDFVVVGENPGSKLAKAKKLGLKIITEKEFLEMIK